MTPITVLFFGSFQYYSTIVLEALHRAKNIKLLGVITTPPRPAKTHTHIWAERHGLPVLTPPALTDNWKLKTENLLGHPDFFIVAGYRPLLPSSWLEFPTIAALNLHPSLLPAYPGPNPAEWAIFMGEKISGITIIKMNEEYDRGPIIEQKKLSISPTETRETLYQKLYELGGQRLVNILNTKYLIHNTVRQQTKISKVYARRLHRPDAYIPWEFVKFALEGKNLPPQDRPGIFSLITDNWPLVINRAIRALAGYPGVWTHLPTTKGNHRLKLISSHLSNHQLVLDTVQLAGYQPSTFNQIKNQII